MGNRLNDEGSTQTKGVVKVRDPRWELPAAMPASCGVLVVNDKQVQGVVETKSIPDLLKAFGFPPSEPVGIPFHRMRKEGGEQKEFRIETSASHVVENAPVIGHQWLYREHTL